MSKEILGFLLILSVLAVSTVIWKIFSLGWGKKTPKKKSKHFSLERHDKNPIIAPNPKNHWESEATFNPGAVKIGDKVHLIYRAIGKDGVSRFGYAASLDGINFEERSVYPVFEPLYGFDMPDRNNVPGPYEFNPNLHPSGGSWGGCEDPRLVEIDGNVYMIYVAFGGWDFARLALTSISSSDLRKRKWRWKKPVPISPPREFFKNWVLFPEKINGKFAILHAVTPKVLIDYIDSFSHFDGKQYLRSSHPETKPNNDNLWESRLRGAGPPPIKTELGWLLFYHAMDKKDPNKYKLGAMILDAKEPTKVLYRSPSPILSPDMPYENDWKPGVIYASGAVIMGDHIHIYYGGGDKVVCVATANLKSLLNYLVTHKKKPRWFFSNRH